MYNGKKTILTSLMLCVIIPFSCSKSNESETYTDKQIALLSSLSAYNTHYMSTGGVTKGKNAVVVALADVEGAWAGGKVGFKAGAKIGSFLGSPHYGAATGALVGGLAWGAFQSYLAYEPEGVEMPFDEFYRKTLPIAVATLIERDDYVTEKCIAVLDSVTCISGERIIPSEQIDFSDEYKEEEIVGIGHNYALEMALEKECALEMDLKLLGQLSELDREILLSKEFFDNLYAELTNTIENKELKASDVVFDSFMEIYSTCREEDVLEIADDYVEMIASSQALSKEEEKNIYSALSVAVNTAHYWSHRERRE